MTVNFIEVLEYFHTREAAQMEKIEKLKNELRDTQQDRERIQKQNGEVWEFMREIFDCGYIDNPTETAEKDFLEWLEKAKEQTAETLPFPILSK